MKKSEFKKNLLDIFTLKVDNLTENEKISFIKKVIIDLEKDKEYDQSNKGNSWSDDELKLILQTQPTKENILLTAKAFKRGYGSIEQIFRWASEDQKSIDTKRPDDKFIQQIKRIAKEIGWRAT